MIITNSPLRRYVNPSASFVDPYSKTESLLMAFCNRAFGSEIMTCHQETTHSFTPGGGGCLCGWANYPGKLPLV